MAKNTPLDAVKVPDSNNILHIQADTELFFQKLEMNRDIIATIQVSVHQTPKRAIFRYNTLGPCSIYEDVVKHLGHLESSFFAAYCTCFRYAPFISIFDDGNCWRGGQKLSALGLPDTYCGVSADSTQIV